MADMDSAATIKVIIAGGGTGGHLYPGIALAEEIEKRWQAKILFIGTSYGIENKVIPKTHYEFKKIWMRGLQRKMSIGNLLFPFRLLISLIQCAFIILAFRPDLIIGTGGYVSGPVLMMGIAWGVPTIIQEQNSFPGLVNRLLGKWADQVHVTYEASLRYFKDRPNIFVSGNPVRGNFNKIERTKAVDKFNLRKDKITLFIFGGSQGSRAINMLVLNSLERLMTRADLQILWASGPSDFELVANKCQHFKDRISLHPYIEDMAWAYAASDVVLCRSGASALSEITICGLPSILIPFPYSTSGHQEFNARTMEKAGAAIVILEESLTEDALIQSIVELLNDPNKRKAMSKAARQLSKPDAAKEIVDKIEELIGPFAGVDEA
jgi:UDP-N-acetylglucosamine--N-acetylmuramyl-(pentapeptide) pyrophosphoryl-undecaprenol N-acetylglucosamine transferase